MFHVRRCSSRILIDRPFLVAHGQPRPFKISQTAMYLEIKTSIAFGRTRWSLNHRLGARMTYAPICRTG